MKCHDDTDNKHGSVYVESRVNCAAGKCLIDSNNTSTQKVVIKNYKDHALYVDIKVESKNKHVKYTVTNSHTESKPIPVPGKKKNGHPGKQVVKFKLKQDRTDSQDVLAVSITYSPSKKREKKNVTVPSVYPTVDLV